MLRLHRPFLPIFLLMLLAACGGSKSLSDTVPVPEEKGTPGGAAKDQRAQVMSIFMDATRARLGGDPVQAMHLFEACLQVDPKNAASMFELAKLYDQSQMAEPALDMARKAVATDKENIWYRFLLADLCLKHQRTAEASEVYRGMVKQWPDRYEVYFDLANSLAVQGKVSDARQVYRDLEKRFGFSEELVMNEFDMLASHGQLSEARLLLENAVQRDPSNFNYRGMLAEVYDELSEPDKALAQYELMLAEHPDDGMTRISLAEHYYGTGEMTKAFEQLNIAFADPDLEVDPKMQLVLGFFDHTRTTGTGTADEEKLLARCYELIATMEKAHPESGKPHTLHGDFLLRDGKAVEAREQFRMALRTEQDRFPIWQQLLQLDLQLRDDTALHEDAVAAIELFPTQPVLYLYQGTALSNLKRYDEATEALILGRDLVVDDTALQAQFWNTLGETYNDAKNFPKSDDAFDHGLVLQPDNANALNNYAYYLSLRGERLDKAAAMSKRSNELEPTQTSYQDTYAWVLFKQAKYTEARVWAEKAIASGGSNSGEVLEHYGDILFRLGDSAGAMEQWRRAKELGDTSTDIDRKVSEGRLPE